jgi:hypothetical protein
MCGRQKVELQGTAPRKLDMGSSPIAKLARAIWQNGRRQTDNDYIGAVRQTLFREEKRELASFFKQLPMWINDELDRVRTNRRSKYGGVGIRSAVEKVAL